MDFTISANNRVKKEEREKINKYLDLAKEDKKLGYMQVNEIAIVVDALKTIPKNLKNRLGNWRSVKESKPPSLQQC